MEIHAPGRHNVDAGRLSLLIIFFLSGASGLVYQVVWSRGLVLVFGSTTHAISTVLAAFMGGLALGSLLLGRRADRFANPLKIYALLEAVIAVLGVAVLAALPALVPIYRAAFDLAGASPPVLNAARFLLACLVLLPPTALMGATLPILSAHLERGRGDPAGPGRILGAGAGALYAANTIGAVAGTALAGFALLPALGMWRSALVAAGANLLAAGAALRLSSRERPGAPAPLTPGEPVGALIPWTSGWRRAALLAAFAASGAGALVFEVVWTRILALILGSSTQAFSIMLTTFLAGLALGSAAATRWLPRISNPVQAFCLVELGAGLTAYLGVHLFPQLPYTFLALFESVGSSAALFQSGRFGIAALVMLPPTLLLGACFPLAARAALGGRGGVALAVSGLYSANTLGAIAGSTAAGFLLIPWLGLQASLVAGCVLNLAAGAALMLTEPGGRSLVRFGPAVAVAAIAPGLLLGLPEWNGMLMSSGVYQYAPRYVSQFSSRRQFNEYHQAQRQLYYRDGPTASVAVERRPDDGRANLILSVNGKVDASSVGDMETQVLLAHLPMLAAPASRSMLIVGMGSGVTAGSALAHPIDELDVVEIEPAILEAEVFFREINGRPTDDPRLRVRINDARNDLLVSRRTYDVIISEPSNPWITGPSKLFTREFFELASLRLNESGILCQWIQLYGMDQQAIRTVLRTFASVFPHRMVFKGAPGDLVVLGSHRPIRLDAAEATWTMRQAAVRADLARIQVEDLAGLLARFRLGDDGVERFAGSPLDPASGPLNTDDNALVEFAAARTMHLEDARANDQALADVLDSPLPFIVLSEDLARPEATSRLPERLAGRLLGMGLTRRAGLVIEQGLARPQLAPPRRAALIALRGDLLHAHHDAEGALSAWQESLRIEAAQPRAVFGLASRMLASGDMAQAELMLRRAESNPRCRLELARLRLEQADPRQALALMSSLGPGPGRVEDPEEPSDQDPDGGSLLHLYRGRAHAALKDHAAAARELEASLARSPRQARPSERRLEAGQDLARVYLEMGRHEEARRAFRQVILAADELSSWSRRQADASLRRRDLPAAAEHLRTALRWNPDDPTSRRLYARALNDLGRPEEAVQAWRGISQAEQGDPEALRNIAGLSLRAGHPADAIAALRQLRELESSPEGLSEIDATIRRIEGGMAAAQPPAQPRTPQP